jgi:two-component system OmpR family sensor kinase
VYLRSLSGRLLVGVVALMLVALVVADAATYLALQKFLLDRIDGQLTNGRAAAVSVLAGPDGRFNNNQFPIGTVLELVDHNGKLIGQPLRYDFPNSTATALPQLPSQIPAGTESNPAVVTLQGSRGVGHYRAAIWPEDSFQGNYVVLAIPMDDIASTLNLLLVLEVGIGIGVLVATVLLALLIVRIGLRPLERMGAVAQDIAAGDLTRRVEPATPETEIGRLGAALNAMLSQIEAAFAERTRSENRLRRFIADASHELRTPLTSVRGYAEMLRRGAEKSPEDSAVARRRIEEESVRMSVMVDDMLVLARLGQGRPLEREPVDLQAVAQDAVADARAVAPQREISLDAPRPVVVTGDDTRLRQVMGNLVRNAVVHTPADSAIDVSVTTHDGVAVVQVADHGPGLSAEDSSRIFEPFYRADPSRSRDSGGVGLGLSIVSAVAAAHGGTVRMVDTPGGGATFVVELPIEPNAPENKAPAAGEPAAGVG